jgi:3-oxoacyl-[acyl-carrier-protein] synthase-3
VPTVIESVATARNGRWRRRSAHALADAVARRALGRAGLAPSDVDLLINAGLYHNRNLGEPALASLIQEDIGANPEDPHAGGHGTFSFDVANGSCGMLSGLQIADGFLRAGTIRHALVVASDARPGRRLAPDFPFGATGAAIVCGWRSDDHGIQGFRFANRPPDDGVDDLGEGLRATVGFAGGRNRLTFAEQRGFAATAGAWAGEVAGKLLADHGLQPGDVDLVVANPLTAAFLGALAARLGVDRERLVEPTSGRGAHTAGLGMALAAAAPSGWPEGRTALLVSAGAGPVAGAALLR